MTVDKHCVIITRAVEIPPSAGCGVVPALGMLSWEILSLRLLPGASKWVFVSKNKIYFFKRNSTLLTSETGVMRAFVEPHLISLTGVLCSSLLLAASPPGFRNSILMYLGSLPLYLFIKYFAQCLWLILSYDFIGKPVMPWNLFPCCLAFFIWILMSFLGILTLNCFSSISYIMNCFPLESFYFIFLSLYIWKNVKILWNIYSKNNFSLWHHSDGILNSLG